MKLVMAIAALVMLAGCTAADTAEPPRTAETIRYEAGPCFGTCPVYVVTVSSDGRGMFEGKRFTSVAGSRSFRVTTAQFQQFKQALAPYRPNGLRDIEPGKPDCRESITDSSTVRISRDRRDRLTYYTGCSTSDAAMSLRIRRAPDLLPLADLIGKRVEY